MSSVLLEQRQAIAVLTLNRPEVRNALGPALQQELLTQLDSLEQDPSVRVLVLTGAGKAFCSGADLEHLKTLSGATSEARKADTERLAFLFERLYLYPKPVIAAVEGAAIAGGAGLATACDLVIMAESARIGYTEVRLGFVAALVGVLLLRAVGEKHARDLLLTGKLLPAPEAHRIGLVNEVVADGTALARALAVAEQLLENSSTAMTASKELLAILPGMGFREAMCYATGLNAWVRSTADFDEGLTALLEKRTPRWQK